MASKGNLERKCTFVITMPVAQEVITSRLPSSTRGGKDRQQGL